MGADPQFEIETALERGVSEPAFVVDVDGFEGPLDLLLELARRQKVDLAKISVLALAEQYLAFVEEARRVRLELAADYLVMAAWLAYLKSRLLLPEPPKAEGPAAADLAAALALRLRRLEAIRVVAGKLADGPRLGRDMALNGQPEGVAVERLSRYTASLFDLLSAYAAQRETQALARVTVKRRLVWSIADARAALERLAGIALDWTVLDEYLVAQCVDPAMRRTVRASAFSATLEMIREGIIDVRQDAAFAPLWVRRRREAREPEPARADAAAA